MNVGNLKVNLSLDAAPFMVSVRDADRLLRSLEGRLDQTGASVKRLETHVTSVGASFSRLVRTLGMARFALLDLYDVFLRLPVSILKTTGELERMTKLMEGLSTATTQFARAQEAASATDYITKMAQRAPFQMKTLTDAAVKLKVAGFDPVKGSLDALVDSVAKFGGTSDQMHRASIAIQQMAGKGVISMEELRQQLGEAIPNAIKTMADATGLSIADLVEKVSKGQVVSAGALARMLAMMSVVNAGAAADMMETWSGMIEKLKSQWMLFQNDIGKAGFMDAAKDAVKGLSELFEQDEMKRFAFDVGRAMGEVVLVIRDVAKGMANAWPYIKMVGEGLIAYFVISKLRDGLVGISSSMGRVFQESVSAAKAQANLNNLYIAAQAENARFDAAKMARVARGATEELIMAKAKYAELQALHASHLHSVSALDTYYRLNSRGRPVDEAGKFVSSAVYASNQASIAQAERGARVAEMQMAAEAKRIQQLETGIIATRMASQEKLNMAGALEKTTEKAVTLTSVLKGFGGFVVNALGGWLGVVTTALWAGYMAWDAWGNQGEKALKKIKSAIDSGLSNKETVSEIKTRIGKVNEELAGKIAQSQAPNIVAGGGIVATRLAREIKDLQREKAMLETSLNAAAAQATEGEVGKYVSTWQKGFDKKLESMRVAGAKEITLANDTLSKMSDGLKGPALKKLEDEFTIKRGDIAKKTLRAELDYVTAERKRIEGIRATVEDPRSTLAKQLDAQLRVARDIENAKAEQWRTGGSKIGTIDLLGTKNKRKPTQPVDPLGEMLAESQGQLERATIRLEDLEDGVIDFNKIYDATAQKMWGRARAGDFDEKDAGGNVIKFLDAGGGIASEKKMKIFEEVVFNLSKIEETNAARTVATRLLRMQAGATEELTAANNRIINSGEKEVTAFTRVNAQLAAMKTRLSDGTMKQFLGGQSFDSFKQSVLSTQAGTDMANFLGDLIAKQKGIRTALIDNDRDRKQAEYSEEVAHLNRMFDLRKKHVMDTETVKEVSDKKVADMQLLFNEHMALLSQKHAKDMRTPLQQLEVQWLDVTKNMQDATARWAGQFVDGIVEMVKTGKLEWRKLLESFLTDVLRMQLQQRFAKTMSDGLGKMGDWMLENLLGKKADLETANDLSLGEAMSKGAANAAADRMAMSLNAGAAQMAQLQSATSFQTIEATNAASSLARLSAAADAASASMGGRSSGFDTGGIGDISFGDIGDFAGDMFANGGIMTSMGSIPLKKFGLGGIANGPMMSVFGEGSTPEAYVPLPDGRSIPVSMNGATPSVTVNVINQSGTPVNAQQGQPRFDGKQMVLDIVLQAASSPGPFRDGMKSAVG